MPGNRVLSAGVTVGVAVDLDARKIFFATDGQWDEVPAFSEEDRSFHHQIWRIIMDYHGLWRYIEVFRHFLLLVVLLLDLLVPAEKVRAVASRTSHWAWLCTLQCLSRAGHHFALATWPRSFTLMIIDECN
jgi:hypothetical protein